ncbi:MAG: OmpA family protein [Bacteroidota bacterium]
MKNRLLNALPAVAAALLFTFNTAQAQIQWAAGVDYVSSEATNREFGGGQALGEPNSLPQGGESPVAWQPLGKMPQFLKVKFAKPQKIEKIMIVESIHPGLIAEIIAYDAAGTERYSAKLKPQLLGDLKTRIFTYDIPLTDYEVASVGVVVKMEAGEIGTSIDAIGIGMKGDNWTPKINLVKNRLFEAEPVKQSDALNSDYNELNPLVTADGKTMYFSRRNSPQNVGGEKDHEDIWVAEMDKDTHKWKKARNFGAPFNNEDPNFVCSVTPDGAGLLLGNVYLPNGVMEAGCSFSYATETGWSDPEKAVFINFRNLSEKVDYFLSNSGKIMIISAQKEKTMGGRDLYVSFLVGNFTWSEPQSMGSMINTAADEYAPYLASDNRTIYFASEGFPTYGLSDIFVAHRIGDSWNNWTTPENLGPKVNTAEEDAYFSITASGEAAYFSSARGGKNLDIWRMSLPAKPAGAEPEVAMVSPVVLLCGTVIDNGTGKPMEHPVRLVYENLANGEELGITRTKPKSGTFAVTMPAGINYGYFAVAPGYLSQSGSIDLSDLKTYREIEHDLVMIPDKVGAVLTINNIFFDLNKADLQKESFPELKRVAKYMELNPNVKIEVSGHTDNSGTDAINNKLSQERAQSVKDFLVSQKISADRLVAKGYGSTKPSASNKNEKGRAKNRRVECTILSR